VLFQLLPCGTAASIEKVDVSRYRLVSGDHSGGSYAGSARRLD
jgi:hypothetical protein